MTGGFGPAREADDPEVGRGLAVNKQVVQGRDQLAIRQVSARAEDDNGTRFRGFTRVAEPAKGRFFGIG